MKLEVLDAKKKSRSGRRDFFMDVTSFVWYYLLSNKAKKEPVQK